MPAKHVVKTYLENGIYHIFNRGVDRRTLFLDDQDYRVFLHILQEALSDPTTLPPKKGYSSNPLQGDTLQWRRMPKNYYTRIELFAYCLTPNHFHLLLRQNRQKDMHEFLQSVAIRYSVYFNKKYSRLGPLFQHVYKAALVTEEPYLLHLTRYIHRNPKDIVKDLTKGYSSYADYLGKRHTPWLNTSFILSFFRPGTLPFLQKHHTYEDFVEQYQEKEDVLGDLVLERDNDLLQGDTLQ